jgi:biopolymer transport protein ExbD
MTSASSEDRFELNLTPLLDVVLQLIMFFMMCVNFVSDQVNPNVKLPASSAAQEIMAKTEVDVLIINIEVVRKLNPGEVLKDVAGQTIEALGPDQVIRIIFHGVDNPIVFREAHEEAGLRKAQGILANRATMLKTALSLKSGKPIDQVELKATVIVRADAEADSGLVVRLMAQCTKEGFPKIECRALTKTV